MSNLFCIFLIVSAVSSAGFAKSNLRIESFSRAKAFLNKNLDQFNFQTLYCSCQIQGKIINLNSCNYRIYKDAKRASRLEWEHVVPAEAFGKSFPEWRDGSKNCVRNGKPFKGRKCAETNSQFRMMESDLYNLVPEIGELNGLRSNYSMAELQTSEIDFGGCNVKLEARKFEPQNASKGIVARTYLNMENRYPGRGIVSSKNIKLFEAWNRSYPVEKDECVRWENFKSRTGYRHLFAGECNKFILFD